MDHMKVTIVGPYNHGLLEKLVNGGFKELKSYKIFVGDAYEAYKKSQHNADSNN